MTKKTIYDIAKDLNLAPSTISKVINHKGNVSDATRKRVLDYVKEVGYVPTSSARMIKSGRSYSIGVVFTEELNIGLEHAFFSSLLQHFKTYAERQGYELSFIVSQLGNHKMSYYEWCLNKKVDGVYIVVGAYDDKGILDLAKRDIPVVSNDILLDGIKTFISNNEQGINIALDFFFNEAKLKRVGMISGPLSSRAFKTRHDAFYKYFDNKGLTVNPNHIVESKSFGFTSGYKAMEQMIKNQKELPEGIIVGSDDIAIGVLRCLYDNNIKVPEEIQLIGFDDIHSARLLTPSLSTIRQDTVKLGEAAAASLIKMIEDPTFEVPQLVELPVNLILRETTKKY